MIFYRKILKKIKSFERIKANTIYIILYVYQYIIYKMQRATFKLVRSTTIYCQ